MTLLDSRNSQSSHSYEPGRDALLYGTDTYKPKDCLRFTGACLPPNGTPTVIHNLENLSERLEHLAFGARPEGLNAPPLETYTTTTAEHGDVYRATDEYVRWFHAQYPKAGTADRLSRRAPSPPVKGVGGPEISFGLEGVEDF
jgi:hypothetical protein